MKIITIKVVLEEILWARRKNSGILVIDDETMLDNIEIALEKQIPKKVGETVGDYENSYYCDRCGQSLRYEHQKYCEDCGGKQSW